MIPIARLVRWSFALQAMLYGFVLLAEPWLIWRVRSMTTDPARTSFLWTLIAVQTPLLIGLTAVFSVAWWTLGRGHKAARGWAIAASVLSLPLLGIGTTAGAAGLLAFWKPETVRKLATASRPKPPRIPGDGTSRLLDYITKGAAIAGAIAANFFWTAWGSRHGLPYYGFTNFLIQLEIACFLSVAVHEAGHVLGGWACHMKLRRLEIGPFDWRIRSGKWEFHFDRGKILTSSGCAAMVMTRLKNLRSQRVYIAAAGPVASLMLGAVALLATLSAPGRPWQSIWLVSSVTATLGLLSFAINLVPLRPDDQYSDGAHIYQTVTNGPWADVHMIFSLVASSVVTSMRPRDYEIERLTRAARFLKRGREGMLLRLFAYMHFADCGNIPKALLWLAEAEAFYGDIAEKVPADLHPEFVFANAFYKRDAVAARMWWQLMEAKGVTRFDSDYWKARAALAWIENRTEDSRESWAKGNALAQALPQAGAYDFDRDNFAMLGKALKATVPPELPVPPPLPQPALAFS
jgi:hypothetical protein